MRYMTVVNETRSRQLCTQAGFANHFFSRLKGLLGKKELQEGEGLIISPCNMVHSIGMRMTIDVLFLNKAHEVVYYMDRMPPNRFSPHVKEARYVIELPPGMIAASGTEMGDRILSTSAASNS